MNFGLVRSYFIFETLLMVLQSSNGTVYLSDLFVINVGL